MGSVRLRVLLVIAVIAFPLAVFAQEVATSSPDTEASSTPPIIVEETTPADTATTTERIVDGTASSTPEDTNTATSTPETNTASSTPTQEQEITPIVTTQATTSLSDVKAKIEAVAALEDQYIAKHGAYLQVLLGNRVVLAPNETASEHLGGPVDDHIRVDVYQSPLGWGYQVIYSENGLTDSRGYGPEAASRTFVIEPVVSNGNATSTSAVSNP